MSVVHDHTVGDLVQKALRTAVQALTHLDRAAAERVERR